jgi:hypothetical protein
MKRIKLFLGTAILLAGLAMSTAEAVTQGDPEPYCLDRIKALPMKDQDKVPPGTTTPLYNIVYQVFFEKEYIYHNGYPEPEHPSANDGTGDLESPYRYPKHRPVYYDQTGFTTNNLNVRAGESLFITIYNKPGNKFFGINFYAFVDLNQDDEFTRDELLSYSYLDETDDFTENGTDSYGNPVSHPGDEFGQQINHNWTGVRYYTLPGFTIPNTALTGSTRLRIVAQVNSADPCGNESIVADYGSILDFTLNIFEPSVITTDHPEPLDFGNVQAEGTSISTDPIRVILSNRQGVNLKTAGTFRFARAEEYYTAFGDSVFKIASNIRVGRLGTAPADTADVKISFTPPFGGEYLDTLIIRSMYAEDYRIPLSGTGLGPLVTAGTKTLDFGDVLIGETKTAEQITVTFTDPVGLLTDEGVISLAKAEEYLGTDSTFKVVSIERSPSATETADVVAVTLSFAPVTPGEYLDTLVINATKARAFRIPLSGTGFKPAIAASLETLNFDNVLIGETKTAEVITVTLTDPLGLLTDEGVISLAKAAEYAGTDSIFKVVSIERSASATEAADVVEVTLSFTPVAPGEYRDTLLVNATHADEYSIPLNGTGFKPVIAASLETLNFDNVLIGETKTAEVITVTLTDPVGLLTDEGVISLAKAAEYAGTDSIFKVVTIERSASATETADVVAVTLSFTPVAPGEYRDTLLVNATGANEYSIPLNGTGIEASAISKVAAAAIGLSVNAGTFVVSHAPVGSTVKVYDLYGQLLKTQPVTSDIEILETAAWPKSIYVVVVEEGQQEIFKLKTKN